MRLEKQPHTPHISLAVVSHCGRGEVPERSQRATGTASGAGDGPSPPLDCLVCWVPRLSRCEGRPPNKERLSSLCQVAWSFCSLTASLRPACLRPACQSFCLSVCLSAHLAACLPSPFPPLSVSLLTRHARKPMRQDVPARPAPLLQLVCCPLVLAHA